MEFVSIAQLAVVLASRQQHNALLVQESTSSLLQNTSATFSALQLSFFLPARNVWQLAITTNMLF